MTIQTSHTEPPCICGGSGWIVQLPAKARPTDTGQVVACPKCADFFKRSRLTAEEREYKITNITDRPDDKANEARVLRFMAKEMLRDPYGFSSTFGSRGAAKSLYLCVLVAEFCRAGRQAVYFNSDEIVALLSPGDGKEIDGFAPVPGNPDAMLARLKAIPVLAIDELDKIPWSAWQVQKIGALIEYRHRNAAQLVTLFAMNRSPWAWPHAEQVAHIADRLADGRFNRYWPDEHLATLPGCLAEFKDNVDGKTAHYAPGLFEAKLGSMRSQLRRPAPPRQPAKARTK